MELNKLKSRPFKMENLKGLNKNIEFTSISFYTADPSPFGPFLRADFKLNYDNFSFEGWVNSNN